MYNKHPEMVKMLRNIVGNVVDIKSIDDMHIAFQKDIAKAGGKTVMLWNIWTVRMIKKRAIYRKVLYEEFPQK